MRRGLAALAAVVVLASVGTGVLVWRLRAEPPPKYPQISAYSHGQTVRVGPYRYCLVLDPTDCEVFAEQGELPVTERNAVQLSVPPAISKAPWVLLRQYEDAEVIEEFRPNTRLAVTIPTLDPRRGKLTGLTVMLPTLIRVDGEEVPAPHAEWSVRTVWS
ncbi:DUF2771 domain-containing protein [Mycolicibacterium flavescens]|uniref:DUF2771 domain-containing protein n=1 Tax=Mycolicibacterium flavescens TaxID=1776 RepID=A0A1E3RDP6_MYCFV|nr:DUF2771 domain-containing protein [Mycolicibacterium flavescens]MCV7280649.1 DUF2771 domain-containing protein [Mycolicibacterium flavescens]ODQ88006.1 hypothetical protein BHQ18_20685 [Mycolicibacterium flavescens]